MLVTNAFLKKHLRPRDPVSHKGQNGIVLVLGGSARFFGSPALVALSALRAGADLTYLLTPKEIAGTVASFAPDLIVFGYNGTAPNKNTLPLVAELSPRARALVIGNGITKEKTALETAARIIEEWKKPILIDADALQPGIKTTEKTLLTPHEKEFERIAKTKPSKNTKNRAQQVKKLARDLACSILLKGVVDIVSDGERAAFNKTGNSGMTKGGTGDTLAGIAGAFLSQNHEPFIAACLAAYINGAAGDAARKKLGCSFLASELIGEIPAVMKQFIK